MMKHLEKAFRATSALTIMLNAGGEIVWMNDACRQYTGYSPTSGQNTISPHFFSSSDQNKLSAMICSAVHGSTQETIDIPIICEAGSIQNIRWSILFAGDENPTQKRFILFGSQIPGEAGKSALQLTEKGFRSLVANMQDALYRCDTKGNLTFINLSGARSLGFDQPQELIGKHIAKDLYFHPELRGQFVKDLALDGKVTNYEVTLRHKNGSPIHIVTNSRYYYDPDGHILGVEGLFLDITRRKEAEKVLKENEDQLLAITQNLPGVVYQFYITDDGTYRLSYVSGRMWEIFGLVRDEASAFSAFFEHVHGEDQSSFMDSINKAVEARTSWDYEGRFVKPSGETIWFHGLSTPAWYEGRLVFNGILLDITERKLAGEKKKEAEILYSTLVNALPDGVILTDLDGRIIFASHRALTHYGFDHLDDIGGRSIMEFVAQESYEKAVTNYRNLVHNGGVMTDQYFLLKKDGSRFPAEIFGSLITDAAGSIKGTLYVTHDITDRRQAHEERKNLEQMVFQAQKMEAIGKLAGGVAHDFNNILMGIQGNASLMLMEVSPEDPHHQRLSRIEEHVGRGTRLTRQLLGFARGGKYEVKVLSVNELVRNSVQIFVETRKEIEAEFQLQKDVYPVDADAGQIEQVLLNLCINAAHAMPQGGFLHISTGNIELPERDVRLFKMKPGHYVKISITDTGTGMDRDTLEKIFEPFFTTKAQKGGTGLGLASAYGIIRNHGGYIQAESEVGCGATFNIFLPASSKSVEQEYKAPSRGLIRGNGCILMVDDEPMILHSAAEVLTMLGYKVYQAASGQEAVAIYLQKKDCIDLVILDMILPGMNGSQVLKMLKEANPDVKVILTSGYGIDGEVRKVMDSGCRIFIQKPYRFPEFSSIVHQVLHS
jgi:PAS domain S-box-containing protein